MGAIDDGTALRVFAVATFRAATFIVAFALSLHLTGRLPGILGSLNTELGFAAFALLWTTTVVATRAERRRMADGESSVGARVMTTTVAGAWNGLYVWAAMLAVLVINAVSGSGAGALIFALLGIVIGGVLAFTLGAVVGLAYGSVEAVLLQISAVLPSRTSLTSSSSTSPAASRP
jgi:hypothetical protein